MTTKSYQILAPAGSVEQLTMAVNNGADAVYLGLGKFNARMKAPNFTEQNIAEWVDFCHLFGVKVYVAINISLKNIEFQQAVETLKVVYLANADGVILTDLSLIKIASSLPKPFEIVASTQLNCHDKYGAEFLKNLGVDTVVCARECSFDDIKDIASIGVKVESFLHGALCVCQSGQCLFSSIVGGNSGNRGLCAQPCRKNYFANGNEGYWLSPRDMYGLDVAQKLMQSGASVFKIEGRNRRAEYAGLTSQVYSKTFANDFYYHQTDKNRLAEMYNRGGFENLSYFTHGNGNIIYPKVQSHIGVPVGIVKGKGFVANVPIAKGDGLKVLSNGKEVCGGVATGSGTGFITAEFSGKVINGMVVNRTTSVELCNEIANNKRKLNVEIELTAFENHHAFVTAKYGDVIVSVESDFVVQVAQNKPLTHEIIAQQFSKTTNSYYTIINIVSKIGNIFISNGQLNALRREILDKLTDAIVNGYNSQFDGRRVCFDLSIKQILESATLSSIDLVNDTSKSADDFISANSNNCIAVICTEVDQVNSVQADFLIYKPQFIERKSFDNVNKFVYLDLPSFADLKYLKIILPSNVGLVCHNIGQVQFARNNSFRYIAGSGLNIFNDYIANAFFDADTFVYSLELTLAEIASFKNQRGLIFVDGDISLMKVVHCPYKAVYGCVCSACKCDGKLTYTDELGNTFKIVRRRDSRCAFEIVNGKKLSVANKISKPSRFLMDYNKNVIDHYTNLNNGILDNFVETQLYTKGRLFNKIN